MDVAIRDITSKSGMAISDAILGGQRDPHELACLVDSRMKRSKEEIAQSLYGRWRQEYRFELKAALSFYRHYQQALLDCDQVIEQALRRSVPAGLVRQPAPITPSTAKKKSSKNAPAFAISGLAYHYFKTDLFAIAGVSHSTVLCLLTTLGKDIHKFGSAKSFASLTEKLSVKRLFKSPEKRAYGKCNGV